MFKTDVSLIDGAFIFYTYNHNLLFDAYFIIVGDHGFANKGRKWKETFVFSRDLLNDLLMLTYCAVIV